MKKKNKFLQSCVLNQQHNSGFTLIEILVVMAIIGILATISIGSFQSSQLKARDTQRKNDLAQIQRALETYNNDWGAYPISSSDKIKGCDGVTPPAECEWGAAWVDENGTTYMAVLPDDPRTTMDYFYSSSSGSSYQLYARLENPEDGDIPLAGTEPTDYGVSCGDYNCNYGVASPNSTP